MGTNYYLLRDKCPHCGRADELLHIGKSSSGWCFSLCVYPDMGIKTLEDWKPLLAAGEIEDEYGKGVPLCYMLTKIMHREGATAWTDRNWHRFYPDEAAFHRQNHSERGPNNLLRHRIDGRHCIGHGDGTWDYMIGEFS